MNQVEPQLRCAEPRIREAKQRGRKTLPASRRLVADVLNIHRNVPTCAHDRRMQLAAVDELRRQQPVRIGWPVIFIKAFARLSVQHALLRQTFRTIPIRHIFQHQYPTGLVAVHRKHQGVDWLLWGRFRNPQDCSLADLQLQMDRYTTGPVEEVFRQQLRFASLPTLLRRGIWWWNLHLAGEKRAKRLGTFSLTTLASHGAEVQHPPGFQTSNLTYGPIDKDGCSRITISYDHRLMDGAFVAGRLAELEVELHGRISTELRQNIQHHSSRAA